MKNLINKTCVFLAFLALSACGNAEHKVENKMKKRLKIAAKQDKKELKSTIIDLMPTMIQHPKKIKNILQENPDLKDKIEAAVKNLSEEEQKKIIDIFYVETKKIIDEAYKEGGMTAIKKKIQEVTEALTINVKHESDESDESDKNDENDENDENDVG